MGQIPKNKKNVKVNSRGKVISSYLEDCITTWQAFLLEKIL